MAVIDVEWVYSLHECETCGTSGADGAFVSKDGELLLDLSPHAACFDDTSFDDEAVYRSILGALGLPVPIVDEDAEDYRYDPTRYADIIRASGHELVETDRRRV